MTQFRPLYEVAADIRRTWGEKINYGAKPYLDAMADLDEITDTYGAESAKSIVLYFLFNARTWQGPDARRIKAELNQMKDEG
jgi:hypothetical protein